MDKLQKLLNEHKDKIANWYENTELRQMSWWNFRLYLRNEPWDIDYISLAEILFNTPFLSWLKWKPNWNYSRIEIDDYWNYERTDTTVSDYHKINLCLLDSDSDRLKYLEDNVIIDD